MKPNRALRFVVTGALLVAPVSIGCEEPEPDHINEPAPQEVISSNEVAPPPEEVEELDTVNEPAQDEPTTEGE